MVQELYTEPKEEEILGSFLEAAEANATEGVVTSDKSRDKPKEKGKKKTEVKMKDIRKLFGSSNRVTGRNEEQTKSKPASNVVILD